MPRRQANRNNDEVHRGRFAGRATIAPRTRDYCFTRGLLPPFVPGAARAHEPRSEPHPSIVPTPALVNRATRRWPAIGAPSAQFPAMSLTRRMTSAPPIAVSSHFRRQ
jgi:hypothetical protein